MLLWVGGKGLELLLSNRASCISPSLFSIKQDLPMGVYWTLLQLRTGKKSCALRRKTIMSQTMLWNTGLLWTRKEVLPTKIIFFWKLQKDSQVNEKNFHNFQIFIPNIFCIPLAPAYRQTKQESSKLILKINS